MKDSAKSLIAVLALALLATACIPLEKRYANPADSSDLHERISAIMRKNGYAHEIHSFRSAQGADDDFISVHISLDALRRHNRMLEKMLKEIGAVCQADAFKDIPLAFRFFTDDSENAEYVQKILSLSLGENRSWILEQDSKQEGELKSKLVIRIKHSWIKPLPLHKQDD